MLDRQSVSDLYIHTKTVTDVNRYKEILFL
jgi:hypothetical protein